MPYFSSSIAHDLITLAESYFPAEYICVVKKKHTYEQSLVGRYLVSKIVEEHWGISHFLPRVESDGKPLSEYGISWSISHAGDHVFVGVSGNLVGVDIEIIRPRDESLFDTFTTHEWSLLGEKSWKYFYILWSAKEALVKKYHGGVDEMHGWQLIGMEVISASESTLSFSDGAIREVVTSLLIDGVVRSLSE